MRAARGIVPYSGLLLIDTLSSSLTVDTLQRIVHGQNIIFFASPSPKSCPRVLARTKPERALSRFSSSSVESLFRSQRLANQGIYPGIEYRILEVSVFPMAFGPPPLADAPESSTSSASPAAGSPSPSQQQQQQQQGQDLNSEPDAETALPLASAGDAPPETFDDGRLVFTVRPIYPLVKRLERDDWPVRVAAREFPVMLTPFSYNAATAWAALTTSLSLLTVGFVLSQAFTLSVINSHSMEPTLQVCPGVSRGCLGAGEGGGGGNRAVHAIIWGS